MGLVLVILSAITLILINLIFIKFIVYGRRLLYLSVTIGATLAILAINFIGINIGWYPIVIPGLVAFNIHKESKTSGELLSSIGVTFAYFLVMLVTSITVFYIF